jgi:hypothetical protein
MSCYDTYFESAVQAVMADGSVADGTLAESQAQAAAIWRVREGITESLVRRGDLPGLLLRLL